MILVDTSVWIDHFHAPLPALVAHLEGDSVLCHPLVIEELAVGSLKDRGTVLLLLENVHQTPTLSHQEALALVEGRRLWGRGLGVVDVHLLGATLLTEGAQLWTHDKRLHAAAQEAGIAVS